MIDTTKCYLAVRIKKRFNFLDYMVSNALGSKFIHTEIVFPYMDTHRSFSSRGRVRNTQNKIKGVQFDTVNYMKGKWEFIDLNLGAPETKLLYEDCNAWVGAEYDTRGALFQACAGFNYQNSDEFYCSEICAAVLSRFFPIPDYHLTPEELRAIIRRSLNI